MGLIREVSALDDRVRPQVEAFLATLKDYKLPYMVIETARTIEVQRAYYAQGREPLDAVNDKRVAAGLWTITDERNQKPITWTLQSKHVAGLAVDVVPVDANGRPWWGAPLETWDEYGSIGEACGLEWGGRWPQKDYPHYEYKGA